MKCPKCKVGDLRAVTKNNQQYAVCSNCKSAFTAQQLQQLAAPASQSEKKKGSCLKTGLTIVGIFLGLFILVGIIANLSGPSDANKESKATAKTEKPKATETEKAKLTDTEENTDDDGVSSGTYDIGDISVHFADHVRNDVTEKWRLAKVTTGKDITEYALAYHDMFFTSDDEIHAIINFTLNTTSKLSMLSPDLMEITIMEYVDREEHDASILFSGLLLKQYHLTISTGQLEEIQ